MQVEYLHNHPECVKTVSNWIYSEFIVKSKSNFTLEKVIEYFNDTHLYDFPITLIAIIDYVNLNYRNQGIAEMLINQVLEIVKSLGFTTIYLRTEHTSKYYKRRGWEFVYKTHDEKGQETEVFKYELKLMKVNGSGNNFVKVEG